MVWVLAAAPVLLFLSAGALLGALVLSRRTRLEIEQRVRLIAAFEPPSPEKTDNWLKVAPREFEARLRRVFTAGAGHSWGMSASALQLLLAAAAASAVTWILMRVALNFSVLFAILATAVGAFMAPRIILNRQQKKSDALFTDLFPSAVDSIARMLRAGLPIATAVHSVSVEAPAPVNLVFAMVASQIEIGAPIEEALDATSRQMGLPDFRFFSVAVALQHATGGNLAATLEILSDIIRRRRLVRLKAKSATAEIRVSAYVVGSLPLLMVGALQLIQPGYLAPLFADPRGHVIIGIATGLLLLTAFSMRQMMRSVTN